MRCLLLAQEEVRLTWFRRVWSAGRSLPSGEGESESGGEFFERNGPACLVGPDGAPVAEGGWEAGAGDSGRREVGRGAAAGDADTHRPAWVSAGPINGLAVGVDLVVVSAVREGGGFLDQIATQSGPGSRRAVSGAAWPGR